MWYLNVSSLFVLSYSWLSSLLCSTLNCTDLDERCCTNVWVIDSSCERCVLKVAQPYTPLLLLNMAVNKRDFSLRQKAVALAGQEALMSRLSQSQSTCEHLKEQLEALHRHSLSLQDSCTRLQTLNTQLQVRQTQSMIRSQLGNRTYWILL